MDNQPLQQVPQVTPPSPNDTPKPKSGIGKKIALIIGGIIGVILLILAVLIGLTTYSNIQDKALASKTVSNFYSYSLAKDYTKLSTLYDDPSFDDFMRTTAGKVTKDCKVVDGSYKETSTNADTNTAATLKGDCGGKLWTFDLKKNDKKQWKIEKLVFNGGTQSSTAPSSTAPAATSGKRCLVRQDFYTITGGEEFMSKDKNYYVKPGKWTEYSLSILFNANSLEYTNEFGDDMVAKFVAFDKQNSNKQFTFELVGSVATTAPQDLAFAKQRAEKIKSQMQAAGATNHEIIVKEPVSIDEFGGDATMSDYARRVSIIVNPTCAGSTQSTTGR